jgi:phosphoribosyl 1,2-cyclic phosphodiesterase
MYCRYKFPQITHWIVECNYIKEIIDENVELSALNITLRNRIIKNHMSLETLKDMLRANDLTYTKEIMLMHLSDRNSDADRMKKEIQQLTGKVVTIA